MMYDDDPLVAWEPGTIFDPGYSTEDIGKLCDRYCDSSSMTMFKKAFTMDPALFFDCWVSQARGNVFEFDGVAVKPAVGKVQIFSQKVFHILYEIPIESVPLYVNEDSFLSEIAKWRLEIAK
jgi:hypothetical protein